MAEYFLMAAAAHETLTSWSEVNSRKEIYFQFITFLKKIFQVSVLKIISFFNISNFLKNNPFSDIFSLWNIAPFFKDNLKQIWKIRTSSQTLHEFVDILPEDSQSHLASLHVVEWDVLGVVGSEFMNWLGFNSSLFQNLNSILFRRKWTI